MVLDFVCNFNLSNLIKQCVCNQKEPKDTIDYIILKNKEIDNTSKIKILCKQLLRNFDEDTILYIYTITPELTFKPIFTFDINISSPTLYNNVLSIPIVKDTRVLGNIIIGNTKPTIIPDHLEKFVESIKELIDNSVNGTVL